MHAEPPTLTVAAMFDVGLGYGTTAEYMVRGMARTGARLSVIPLALRPDGLSPEIRSLIDRSSPDLDGPVLYYSWPRRELQWLWSSSALFVNTMWESGRLPAGWSGWLNRATAVIAPSRFVADAFRRNGVTAPVELVPEGIDPEVYRYHDRPPRPGLTTLIVAPLNERKHVTIGIRAWKLAFDGDPDARLLIKTSYNYRNLVPNDPRIHCSDRFEPTRGIAHWYRRADVLLALGNEGFGLPLVEAMATGLPVIALDAEGQADVCRDARGLLIPIPPSYNAPYRHRMWGDCGPRGIPGAEDVARWLRWVAGHPDEAREMGRAASRWARTNRNVWGKGPAVLAVMERYLRQSLRR